MAQIPQRQTIAEQIRAQDAQDFGELLYRQLKNAPWVLASIGVHGVVFLIFMMIPPPERDTETAPQIEMSNADVVELKEEEPPTPEEEKPIEETERVLEDPVLKDAKVSDHNETDNDQETEESLGDPRFNSDSPFEGPGTNGTIGIGGGAGGAFGGRRGGHRNLRAGGTSKKTQTAVDLALEWLKNHQSPDGRWDSTASTRSAS